MRYKASMLLVIFLVAFGCVPKERVVLRSLQNVELTAGIGSEPVLKADALFYNPNKIRLRLKRIKLEVFIDGKKTAFIDQKLQSTVKAESEFSIPLEVKLSLKEIRLFDALASIFGGKKHDLHYKGYIKISVKGFPVKIPVDYTKEVRLRI
jgi:LEA14-like dessication related protein